MIPFARSRGDGPDRSAADVDLPEEDRSRRAETVSVVIPAKNEAANLPWVLARIPDWIREVIVVDGLSTDGTIQVARRMRPEVVIIHETRPGKGAAVRAGLTAASGDIVVMLDADGSMDPAELDRFVAAIRDGADLAKGSRRLPGGGSADLTRLRELGNRGLLLCANALLGTRFSELCYGYMALRRSVVPHLALRADGFEIETEIVASAVRAGVVITEVASFEFPRRAGASNLNALRDGVRIAHTLLRVGLTTGGVTPGADARSPLVISAGRRTSPGYTRFSRNR